MKSIKVNVIKLSYNELYKKNNTVKSDMYLTFKNYKKIVIAVFLEIMKRLITTGEPVQLPYYMGVLQVFRYKVKDDRRPVDYQKTKEKYGYYNEKVPNEKKKSVKVNLLSTNGYWCVIRWSRKGGKKRSFKNSKYIMFSPLRAHLRPYKDQWNPEVSLFPYFRQHMWNKYREL